MQTDFHKNVQTMSQSDQSDVKQTKDDIDGYLNPNGIALKPIEKPFNANMTQ
jgi:hypothetical protein